jgi:hypothetical protein
MFTDIDVIKGGGRVLPLTRISVCEALKARSSEAQGEGAQRRNPGEQDKIKVEPCKGDTSCFALAGLFFFASTPRAAAASQPCPGLCCAALSALHLLDSLSGHRQKLKNYAALSVKPPFSRASTDRARCTQ